MDRKKALTVKAVLFDMDGVITNTMPDHCRAWRQVFLEEGLRISRLEIYQREGQRGKVSVRELLAAHGQSFGRAKIEQMLSRKEQLFQAQVRQKFIPGARKFLKDLHRHGIPLALVTGTSRPELRKILPDHLLGLFSVVVTGNDVRHGKPHPQPYSRALKRLPVSPDHAVAIENAPLGIQSAKAAGLRCLAITTSLPAEYLSDADMIFPSMMSLRTAWSFSTDPSRAGHAKVRHADS